MDISVFITGIIIGITASIPLGPIGVLCIQRTLSKNHKAGFISGLGAATSDTIFASIAMFSLSFVMSFLESNLMYIKAIGGIVIIIMGVNIFLSNPLTQIRRNRKGQSSLWQDYISVFLITLANPALILIFVALFAAFSVGEDTTHFSSGITMLSGVSLGCCSWWFLLTFTINLFRSKIRPRHLLWINRIAGSVIIALGVCSILLIFVNIQINGIF